jgi:hypothetical protein
MKTVPSSKEYTIAKVMAGILLAVTGISAMLGGAALIIDSSGSSLKLPVELLNNTPFASYLLPGLVLFVAVGVLSLAAFFLLLGEAKNFPTLVFYQGVILTGWIMAQIYLLPLTHVLQLFFGLTGIALMLCGSLLMRSKNMNTII